MIRLITDSTSYLPPGLVEEFRITVVPLQVQFGLETYEEGIGMSNADFYRRLTTTTDFPTTSQPSVGRFKAAYDDILAEDPQAEILVITISSLLSGTYKSALSAATQLPRAPITVFDSLSAAMGLGLMVMTAARMARDNRPLADIFTTLEKLRAETHISLTVETLDYLHRGGRIGAVAAFLGNLLNAKPIISLVEGKLEPVDRVRTKKRALLRLVDELENRLILRDQPIQAGVMHIAAPEEADYLDGLLRDRFNVTYSFVSELGPVIGAHLGPGALGAGFCPQQQ